VTYLKDDEKQFYMHLILDKVPELDIFKEEEKKEGEEDEQRSSAPWKLDEFQQIVEIESEEKKIAQEEKQSPLRRLAFKVKALLWTQFINKDLIFSVSDKDSSTSFQHVSIFKLLTLALLSQSQNICMFAFFLNFCLSNNMLSMFPPLSALLYALLDSPTPNKGYWKVLMYYVITVLSLKFLYQLPLFCGSPPFAIYTGEGSCSQQNVASSILVSRYDYIIGIHKFSGPNSYDQTQGILRGIIGDILVILAIILHKNYLVRIGQWHFVSTRNNIYESPAFKCKPSELTEDEQLEIEAKRNYDLYVFRRESFSGRLLLRANAYRESVKNFIMKLMPIYMDKRQRNLDIRTKTEKPLIKHNHKKVKPGKDFFAGSFFSLLLVLSFILFFYRNITGEQQNGISTVNLQRFTRL